MVAESIWFVAIQVHVMMWPVSLPENVKGISIFHDSVTGDSNALESTKASELVPCSLLPHWNSMRFFATVSLYE